MQINWIKISNALSFEYNSNIEKVDQISFNDKLNILIGPNGSGKSNFIQIISEIFKKVFFRACPLNDDDAIELHRDPARQAKEFRSLTLANEKPFRFSRHRNNQEDHVVIKIQIKLTKEDIENLLFIRKNNSEIKTICRDYFGFSPDFANVSESEFSNEIKIVLDLSDENKTNILKLKQQSDDVSKFIYNYLFWFEFIQCAIRIHNKTNDIIWKLLKNNFALVTSSRDFNNFTPKVTIAKNQNWRTMRNQILEDSAIIPIAGEPHIFLMVREKLANSLHLIREEFANQKRTNQEKSPLEILEEKEDSYKKINDALTKHLKLKFEIRRVEDPRIIEYDFIFLDTNDKVILIQELSSGQKGILNFIFNIYGNDLKNGLFIIDEPELHTHPQMQHEFLNLIKTAEEDLEIQFILATHSPVFISPETIEGVHRFYKPEQTTKIATSDVTPSERNLINILNYTNASKIFFVDKVILVEGPSDEYFYRYFLDRFKQNSKKIEFLDIRGKNSFQMWKKFLNNYGISVFYIGDLDNIFEEDIGIIDKDTRCKIEQEFDLDPTTIAKISSDSEYKGTREYRNALLNFSKTSKPDLWENIQPEIKKKYSEGIFILEQGELEDYLGITGRRKKFEKIINFCNNNFEGWCKTASFNDKRTELENIFNSIQ